MNYYENDDHLTAVAQSCRRFNSRGVSGNRLSMADEGISCNACRNWNGAKCLTKTFDSVLTSLEMD